MMRAAAAMENEGRGTKDERETTQAGDDAQRVCLGCGRVGETKKHHQSQLRHTPYNVWAVITRVRARVKGE